MCLVYVHQRSDQNSILSTPTILVCHISYVFSRISTVWSMFSYLYAYGYRQWIAVSYRALYAFAFEKALSKEFRCTHCDAALHTVESGKSNRKLGTSCDPRHANKQTNSVLFMDLRYLEQLNVIVLNSSLYMIFCNPVQFLKKHFIFRVVLLLSCLFEFVIYSTYYDLDATSELLIHSERKHNSIQN